MRIFLFEHVGFIGISDEREASAVGGYLRLELPCDGELFIGSRRCAVRCGEAYLSLSSLEVGERLDVSFKRSDGAVFDCGALTRTGSQMLSLGAPVMRVLVGCCAEAEAQRARILQLEEKTREIEKKYGISVI